MISVSSKVNLGNTNQLSLLLGLALVVAGTVLPLELFALAAIGIGGGIIALLRPSLVLVALPLLVPLAGKAAVSIGGAKIGLLDMAVLAVSLVWLAGSVTRRRIELALPSPGLALLLWVFVAACSLLNCISLRAGVFELAKWGEVLLVFLAAVQLLRKRDAVLIMYVVTLTAVLSALLGIFQFVTGRGPEGFLLFGRFMRAHGTFAQPNPYAGHLGLSLPFALAWAFVGVRNNKERVLFFAASAVILMAILASWSRGAWLGVLVATALMGVWLAPRLATAVLVTVLLTSPLWFGPFLTSSVAQRVLDMGGVDSLDVNLVEPTDDNWAVVERLAHWQAGWYMFASRPWMGVGLGNYEVVYPAFALPRWPDALGHAHNYYLNLLAETGILGLVAYLLLLLAAVHGIVRGWKNSLTKGKDSRAWLLAAMGTLAYMFVHNLVDNLYVNGMHILVAIAFAGIAVSADSTRRMDAIAGR